MQAARYWSQAAGYGHMVQRRKRRNDGSATSDSSVPTTSSADIEEMRRLTKRQALKTSAKQTNWQLEGSKGVRAMPLLRTMATAHVRRVRQEGRLRALQVTTLTCFRPPLAMMSMKSKALLT
jgi:hypothetical protein